MTRKSSRACSPAWAAMRPKACRRARNADQERRRAQRAAARSRRPDAAAADYLASVNLSNSDQETYGLKRLPRPKGRSTHVIVTEYDLPRKEALPHDVIVDTDGHAWYSDFGNQFVGELDPTTGKVTDYRAAAAARRPAQGLARPRARSRQQYLGRHVVSGGRRQDRPQDQAGHDLSAQQGMGRHHHARPTW